jgi:hypothetical protein
VWLTRSYALDHPTAAPTRAGSRFGASLAVKDRRLAESVVTLAEEAAEPIGFLAAPTFGLLPSATLLGARGDRVPAFHGQPARRARAAAADPGGGGEPVHLRDDDHRRGRRVSAARRQATFSASRPSVDELEAVSSKLPWMDAIMALSSDSSM